MANPPSIALIAGTPVIEGSGASLGSHPVGSDEPVFVNYSVEPRSTRGRQQKKAGDNVKRIVFIYNVFFTLKCIVQLAVCVWIKTNPIIASLMVIISHEGATVAEPLTYELSIVLTIVSGVGLLVGFFSCRFSLVKQKKKLKFYAVAMTLIFIGDVIVGALAIVTRNRIGAITIGQMKESLNISMTLASDHNMPKQWDFIQRQLKCCGVEGPGDHFALDLVTSNKTIPESCCVAIEKSIKAVDYEKCHATAKKHSHDDDEEIDPVSHIHITGCYSKLLWYCKVIMGKLTGITCGLSTLQWIGIALSSVLLKVNIQYKTYI